MSDYFTRALSRYSEYEARHNAFFYALEQHRRRHAAVLNWIHEHSAIIDCAFGVAFILYLVWLVFRCYRSWCPATKVEPPVDSNSVSIELTNVDNAIKALYNHRKTLILKLKSE